MDDMNMPSARITIVDDVGQKKTFHVSGYLSNKQARELILSWARDSLGYDIGGLFPSAERLTSNGREFSISLRPTRHYKLSDKGTKPCVITLLEFHHDNYEGTSTPKNFSSKLRVLDPNTCAEREALISMNTPFRFGGETYYQGSFDPRNAHVTILHVVRNPVWLSPYIGCFLAGSGLLIHFVLRLLTFVKNKRPSDAISKKNPKAAHFAPEDASVTNTNGVQKWFPGLLLTLVGLWVALQLLPRKDKGFEEFGNVSVLLNGRVQPIDSVARNALLAISGKTTISKGDGGDKMGPVEWMLELMARSPLADDRRIFRLETLEFRAVLDNRKGRLGFVSLNEIHPHLEQIGKEAQQIQANKEGSQRNGYERDLIHLHESLVLYQRIKSTLVPEGSSDLERSLEEFQSSLPVIVEGVRSYQTSPEQNSDKLALANGYFHQFREMATLGYALCVPLPGTDGATGWSTAGEALLARFEQDAFQNRSGTSPKSSPLSKMETEPRSKQDWPRTAPGWTRIISNPT